MKRITFSTYIYETIKRLKIKAQISICFKDLEYIRIMQGRKTLGKIISYHKTQNKGLLDL